MKKLHIGILALLIAAAGFAIWYKTSHKTEMPISREPIRIAGVQWIGNGVYYVAEEKGFFAKEKVDVEFVNVDDAATGKQLLQSGHIDAFYLTPETVAVLHDSGVRLTLVAANDLSTGADGIIATDSIKSIEDLKGKTVAFEVGSTSHFLLSYLLNEKGLTTNDLTVVENIAPVAGATFVAGNVDAAVTWEPWLSKANERAGGRLLASSKDAPVIFDMPIFRAETVDDRPEDIKAMLRGVFEAQQWIADYPSEAAAIIANEFKITPEEAAAQMQGVHWLSYEENLEMFATGTLSVKDAIQAAGDLWFTLGLIKNKLDANNLVNDSLLKNLYR